MELISIELAKVVSLFTVSRPEGHHSMGKISAALSERYQFASVPRSIEQLIGEKIEFGHGSFNDSRIDLLEIFHDGIVVSAKSPTEKVEAFILDLETWSKSEFGLERVETQNINLAYESHLLIKSQKPLLNALKPLKSVQSLIHKLLFSATKIDAEFEPFGLSFSVDQNKIASMKPARFSVERKLGPSFESNLYFSIAPLKTADHLKVLELLESSF